MRNIFDIKHLTENYIRFIQSFQVFRNSAITAWIEDQIKNHSYLMQPPFYEVNAIYEPGPSIASYISADLIRIFTQGKSPDLKLRKHQSEAITQIIKDQKNTIIATGTGSGKSWCFQIPITQYCLEQKAKGKQGIKAIIIYPMNALAADQYQRWAELLNNSGLKICDFTGELEKDSESARNKIRHDLNRDVYDSEILSRPEARERPPDILITNYKMLDRILVNSEDLQIFKHNLKDHSVWQYLVLDEIHTYEGIQGADVACLIRRLKGFLQPKTLRCIGTSATIGNKGTSRTGKGVIKSGKELIVEFVANIFGEKFDISSVIESIRFDESIGITPLKIPPTIQITDDDIKNYDSSMLSTIQLSKKLLNIDFKPKIENERDLGEVFKKHPFILFLKEYLWQNISEMKKIIDAFRNKFPERQNEPDDAIEREILATFLVGNIANYILFGELQKLLVVKIHLFLTQGQIIESCLTSNNPEDFHLHYNGDHCCPKCENTSYILRFCVVCGGEFWVFNRINGDYFPELYSPAANPNYFLISRYESLAYKSLNEFPGDKVWINNHEEDLPVKGKYCPICQSLECPTKTEWTSYTPCTNFNHPKIEVWVQNIVNFNNFVYCPYCGINHDKKTNEFNTLYRMDIVGKSSAVDLLLLNGLPLFPEANQKALVFMDNRQDTAFQSGHFMDFQRKLFYQILLYRALKKANKCVDITQLKDLFFDEINRAIDQIKALQNKSIIQYFLPFEISTSTKNEVLMEYIEFLIISQLPKSSKKINLQLEKFGLLGIRYRDLDALAQNETYWADFDLETKTGILMGKYSWEQRYDIITFILNFIRWHGAIDSQIISDLDRKWARWKTNLNPEILLDPHNYRKTDYYIIIEDSSEGSPDDFLEGRRVSTRPIDSVQGQFVKFVAKQLNTSPNFTKALINAIIVKFCDTNRYIKKNPIGKSRHLCYQLKLDDLLFCDGLLFPEIQQCQFCELTYELKHYTKNCIYHSKIDMQKVNADNENYFRRYIILQSINQDSVPIVYSAHEHSAQLNSDIRKNVEKSFKDDLIRVVMCTPTLELGIDIGELSLVIMRNVPPTPSNYAQRSGRAGRKGQISLVVTFASAGYQQNQGMHNLYYYNHPLEIISGRINPPMFTVNNRRIIERHINAIIFRYLVNQGVISGTPSDFLDLPSKPSEDKTMELIPAVKKEMALYLTQYENQIIKEINWAFGKDNLPFLNQDFIISYVRKFVERFDMSFLEFRNLLGAYIEELRDIQTKILDSDADDSSSLKMLKYLFKAMIEGQKDYNVLSYISKQGLLPNYGFFTGSSKVKIPFQNRDNKQDVFEIGRITYLAIREFAPRNLIYLMGNRYRVNRATLIMQGGYLAKYKLYVCPDERCGFVYKIDGIAPPSQCPNCGRTIIDSEIKDAIEFPEMRAWKEDEITSEQEDRSSESYKVNINYQPKQSLTEFSIIWNSEQIGTMSFERNGIVSMVNQGTDAEPGFAICTACRNWLKNKKEDLDLHIGIEPVVISKKTKKGSAKKKSTKRSKMCSKNGNDETIFDNLYLYTQDICDILRFDFPCPYTEPVQIMQFYYSLAYNIQFAINITFSLGESEIGVIVSNNPKENRYFIDIYEMGSGGLGVLENLINSKNLWTEFLENLCLVAHLQQIVPTVIEEGDACDRACYTCLKSYYNRFFHVYFNRKIVQEMIVKLGTSSIENVASDNSIETLMNKCESELERLVLREIIDQGLPKPTYAQKKYIDGNGILIAEPDFYYDNLYLALYVDGPPHIMTVRRIRDQKSRQKVVEQGDQVYPIELYDDEEGKYNDPAKITKKVQAFGKKFFGSS